MPKIFGIYPEDKKYSIKFLNKINSYFIRSINKGWHCYKVRPNDSDHEKCITSAISSNAKFILFMGHGRSDALFGSCASEEDVFASYDAIEEQKSRFYQNEKFINLTNIAQFRNKIFFCFSCNSNDNSKRSLGRTAIENGVVSFIGFGDIPTDYKEEEDFPLIAIAKFKGIITSIIKRCIYIALEGKYSVQGLVDLIKLETTKKIQDLILNDNFRHKNQVIKNLFNFKNDIVIFGDRMAKISV